MICSLWYTKCVILLQSFDECDFTENELNTEVDQDLENADHSEHDQQSENSHQSEHHQETEFVHQLQQQEHEDHSMQETQQIEVTTIKQRFSPTIASALERAESILIRQAMATPGESRKRSGLWNHFTPLSGSDCAAKCDLCGHILSHRSSITNLKKHLQRKHPGVRIEPTILATTVKRQKTSQPFMEESDHGMYVVQDDVQEYEVENAEEFLLEVRSSKSKIRKQVSTPLPQINLLHLYCGVYKSVIFYVNIVK